MKRSEMISLIVDSIELHNGNDPGWLGYPEMKRQKEQAYNVADRLLSDLEQAGMLPPKACIERSVRVGDEQRTAYHNTNEWEPEDE